MFLSRRFISNTILGATEKVDNDVDPVIFGVEKTENIVILHQNIKNLMLIIRRDLRVKNRFKLHTAINQQVERKILFGEGVHAYYL